jgi:uncharacterized protein (TIGR00725 family)
MRLKIGVMGGATGVFTRAQLDKAHELGESIAKSGCILLTGGCPGLPFAAACGAKQAGGMVVGISPGLSLAEHVLKYQSPLEFHDLLIYTGSGLMGREVVNIRSSDIVVIVGGRSGTLGELAIAYDEGKLIGVLTGTGGISDLVAEILKACKKETGAVVVYEAEPQRLVEKLLKTYRTSHHHRPSCFSDGLLVGATRGALPDTKKDPVCGMVLSPGAVVARRTVNGRHYGFCSTGCAERFEVDPSAYLPEDAAHARKTNHSVPRGGGHRHRVKTSRSVRSASSPARLRAIPRLEGTAATELECTAVRSKKS